MLNKVCELLLNKQLVLFVGAGISIDPPASVPGWKSLGDELIRGLIRRHPDLQGMDQKILEANLAPEVFSQILYDAIGVRYFDAFRVLQGGRPNLSHRYIAKLASNGYLPFIITANMDTYIEDAIIEEGLIPEKDFFVYSTEAEFEQFLNFPSHGVRIFKIHGTVKDPTSITSTLRQEGQGLSTSKGRILRCFLMMRPFLFIGYSGNDLNINPNYLMLQQLASHGKGFFWNFLPDEKIHEVVDKLTELYGDRTGILRFCAQELLEKLWTSTGGKTLTQEPSEPDNRSVDLQKGFDLWTAEEPPSTWVYQGVGAILGYIGAYDQARLCYEKALKLYKDVTQNDKLAQVYALLGNIFRQQGEWEQGEKIYREGLDICGDKEEILVGKAKMHNGLGHIYSSQGKKPEAEKEFMESLALWESVGQFEGVSSAYLSLGDLYLGQGDLNTSKSFYQKALMLADEMGSYTEMVEAYNRIGILEDIHGNWKVARENYVTGLSLGNKVGYRHGVASLYESLGRLERREGNMDTAFKSLRQATHIRRELSDRPGMIGLYIHLGSFYVQEGDWDQAMEEFEKSLSLSQELGVEEGKASAYKNIGSILRSRGEYEKAIECFDKSLEIEQKLKKRLAMIDTMNHRGLIYEKQGELDKSEKIYQDSLKISEELGSKLSIAVCYNNLAEIRKKKRDLDTALKYFKESLKIKEEIGDRPSIALSYNNIGSLLQNKGDWEGAEEAFLKSLEYNKGSDRRSIASAYGNLSLVAQKRFKLAEAEEYLKKSIEIYEALKETPRICSTHCNMATLFQQKKEFDKAEEYFLKAISIAESKNLKDQIANANKFLAILYETQNKRDKSIPLFEKALSIYESLNNQHEIAVTLTYIAESYRKQEIWDKIPPLYKRSISIQEGLGDSIGLAQTYIRFGHFCRDKNQISEALSCFEKAKDLYEKSEQQRGVMVCWGHIGNIAVKEGNIEKAEIALLKSLEIAITLQDQLEIADAQFNLAYILIKDKRKEEARPMLEKAALVYKEKGLEEKWKQTQSLIGKITGGRK